MEWYQVVAPILGQGADPAQWRRIPKVRDARSLRAVRELLLLHDADNRGSSQLACLIAIESRAYAHLQLVAQHVGFHAAFQPA